MIIKLVHVRLAVSILTMELVLPSLSTATYASGEAECIKQELLDLTLEKKWIDLSEGFQKKVTQSIKANLKHYQAAWKRRDKQAQLLYEAGFRFENPLMTPRLRDFIHFLEGRMDQLVAQGRISREDALYPAFVLHHKGTGQFKPIRFGESIPRGYRFNSESVLPRREFTQFIAAGFFPVSQPALKIDWMENMLMHDISHYCGYIDHPQYAAAVRNLFRKRLQTPHEDSVSRARDNYVLESMSLPNAQPKEKVLDFLRSHRVRPEQSSADDAANLSDYRKAVSALSVEQFASLKSDLLKQGESFMEYYGGGARSIQSRGRGYELGYLVNSSEIYSYGEQGRIYLEALRDLPDRRLIKQAWAGLLLGINRMDDAKAEKELVARFLTYLDHGSRVAPSRWVEAGLHGTKSYPELYRFLCQSGIFNELTIGFNVFCK